MLEEVDLLAHLSNAGLRQRPREAEKTSLFPYLSLSPSIYLSRSATEMRIGPPQKRLEEELLNQNVWNEPVKMLKILIFRLILSRLS